MTLPRLSFDLLRPKPLLLVISGPSGIGKDAVLNGLKKRDLGLHFVVTATSRPPRPNEREGVDYFFVSKETFEAMIAADELIEYALVYNQYKGIPRAQIDAALQSGQDVVVRVDVQGVERIRSLFPDAVTIFLVPTDAEEWYQRLQNRGTETPESLQLRLETARQELNHLPNFKYLVCNAENRLEQAIDTIVAILQAEHHRIEADRLQL